MATTAAPAEISAGRTAPDRAEQPSAAPSEPPPRGSHVWQLARASSPDGFAALRRARGIAADSTRSVQTRRGDWLLLYGDFPSIEAARNARAQAGAGFARAWAQIEAER